MTDTLDDQEVEETTQESTDETTQESTDETAQESTDETTDETTGETALNALEVVIDDLAFLRDDNPSFYLASKAYYDDRNYEEAIEKFQALIEQESPPAEDASTEANSQEEYVEGEDPELEEPSIVLTKSMYWLGESYVKIGQIDKAIEAFEALASGFDTHYLGIAAQRRVKALQANYQNERESI